MGRQSGRYQKLRKLKPEEFKRRTGVNLEIFKEMLGVLQKREKERVGRPSKLAIADQLLLTLEYWREYRTLFHIALDYGVAESTAQPVSHIYQ